jgi:glycosyltransferase involved in cell wall biosynthesis
MEMKISAIILAGGKIDQDLFKKCLDSLTWCDEVVKIDTNGLGGSFADWRNQGAKKARGEWLLYIDADEIVTPELKNVILGVISSEKFSAYAIPRRNIVFGREMKHCGLWPDYVLRLIKKDKLVGWQGELHEQPKIKGEIEHLKEPLIHKKHDHIAEMVDKTNQWSEVEAKLMFNAHHPKMNVARFFTAGFREFWLRMVVQTAFMDGAEGTIYGFYQVFSRLISYAKLWELQIKKNESRNL